VRGVHVVVALTIALVAEGCASPSASPTPGSPGESAVPWRRGAVAPAAPADAPSGEGDDPPDRESLGSRPGERLTARVLAWPAELKSRSHFGFENGSATRDGELAFVKDLGLSSSALGLGVTIRLGLDRFGWVGFEGLGLREAETSAVLERARTANGVELEPGDRLESEAWAAFADVRYGYEVRTRIHLAPGVPLELYASPTIGVGLVYFDVTTRRVSPDATRLLGGHASVWALAPGARIGLELLDHLELGADVVWGMPQLAIGAPAYTEWERLRVFAGLRLLGAELTVGWRLSVTHAKGDGKAGDIRLRGIDATLGFRF
jgi:hypothetical protein